MSKRSAERAAVREAISRRACSLGHSLEDWDADLGPKSLPAAEVAECSTCGHVVGIDWADASASGIAISVPCLEMLRRPR